MSLFPDCYFMIALPKETGRSTFNTSNTDFDLADLDFHQEVISFETADFMQLLWILKVKHNSDASNIAMKQDNNEYLMEFT